MAKKKPKATIGRRTIYKPELDNQAYEMCLLGYTDKQIAKEFGVTERTINNWKAKHPSFFQSLKSGKRPADGKVALSLYQRATGYETVKEQAIKLKEVYWDDDGNRCEREHVEIVALVEKLPPDVSAMIFWLKNREPALWREKPIPEVTAEQSDSFVSALKAGAKLWDMPAQEEPEDSQE